MLFHRSRRTRLERSVRPNRLRAATTGGLSSGVSVVGTETASSGSSVESAIVPIPSGSTGELLVAVLAYGSTGTTVTGPTGWTELYDTASSGKQVAYYRVTDGSEGGDAEWTSTDLRRFAAVMYRISGAAASSFIASEFEVAPSAIATQTMTPSPSVTPSWGSAKNLWIVTLSSRQSIGAFTEPSGYGDQIFVNPPPIGTSGFYCRLATAHRFLSATTEDPDAWGVVDGDLMSAAAATIAVRPG